MQSLLSHATRIKNGNARIKPGQPICLNEAAAVGDGVWQGDLGVEIVDGPPADYVETHPLTQLVPGNTTGSRHTLESRSTVDNFRVPKDYGEGYVGLRGPYCDCREDTSILHPVHGPVHISAGHKILIRYQRNLDEETKRERRAFD